MEVQLTFDQEAKLTRMATEQGRAAETLVQEAVERFLNYDEWFSREVDKGLAAADRCEFVEHDDQPKANQSKDCSGQTGIYYDETLGRWHSARRACITRSWFHDWAYGAPSRLITF